MRVIIRGILLSFISWVGPCLLLMTGSALAWKPYTHNVTANEALLDALDDGQLEINGRRYAVRSEVLAALRQWPQYYNAGVIGPDGFPDLVYGQSVIHPGPTASSDAAARRAFTGAWIQHLYIEAWKAQFDPSYSTAERAQILAFTYGYLTHAAGDMWGHTLVNDFAGGVFPSVAEIFTSAGKAGNAIRHIITEAYIGDATPGYDGSEERGPAPGGDVSDDSTPGFAYDAPHRFLYRALIDQVARTPTQARGALIEFFLKLSESLTAAISSPPKPLAEAIAAYDDLAAAFIDMKEDCNFEDFSDGLHDAIFCPIALAKIGIVAVIDTAEAFARLVFNTLKAAALLVFNSYLRAWIDDIADGLENWGRFGLATTQGLFDAQTRRNVQNATCDGTGGENNALRAQCESGVGLVDTIFSDEGTANNFINNHLLSMLGAPDLVGDVREIVQELTEILDDILNVLLIPVNPLRVGLLQIKLYFQELVEELIEDAIGVDIDALADLLKHPSRFVCLDNTPFQFPDPLGTVTISLFPAGEHLRLDNILMLNPDHHEPDGSIPASCARLADSAEVQAGRFATYYNTILLTKLLLLGGGELNRVLSDLLGRNISLYQSDQNVMIDGLQGETWLRLIDGDHGWRKDGLPRFCDDGGACIGGATTRPAEFNGGTGLFPMWASCVLRPAFRTVFVDWENGADNFPDLGDGVSADPADDPNPPTSSLTRRGTFFDDGTRQFIGADNSFSLTALDTPTGMAFKDNELSLQRRIYTDPLNSGNFILASQGESFSIGRPDGRHLIDIRSADPCHTFEGTPLPPEPTRTFAYWLDTTAPVTVCNTPPFGLTFDTDDVSKVNYALSDGPDGSGIASSSSTIDGYLTLPGVVPITNGAVLDLFLYYPGTRTVLVSARDNIGNASVSPCTFQIHATAASLITNLDRANSLGLLRNQGIYNSLKAKLEAAKKQHDRGNTTAELNELTAYIHELEAQKGKGIDVNIADRFIAFARDLIAIGG